MMSPSSPTGSVVAAAALPVAGIEVTAGAPRSEKVSWRILQSKVGGGGRGGRGWREVKVTAGVLCSEESVPWWILHGQGGARQRGG